MTNPTTWKETLMAMSGEGKEEALKAGVEVLDFTPHVDGDTTPQPGHPSTFTFQPVNAGEVWTDDPEALAAKADPPIIDGLLREREVASVVGAAKLRKTWFTLELGLAVAAGREFIGRETEARKVLYLDYELKRGTFERRVAMLAGERPNGFFFQCLRGEPFLPTVQEIQDYVAAEGFGLVIVDSLYRTGWLSEENGNDSTPRELSVLQRFTAESGCSLVVVDHTAKGGGEGKSAVDAARGASSKAGFWDGLYVLRATDQGGDPHGEYVVLDPVLRDWPAFKKLPLICYSFTSTRCRIVPDGEVDRGSKPTTAEDILEYLDSRNHEWAAPADIREACGISNTSAQKALCHLTKRGRIERKQDPQHKQRFVYRIPEPVMAGTPYRDDD